MGYITLDESWMDSFGRTYYRASTFSGKTYLIYHNDSNIPMKLNSIGFRVATGLGSFYQGASVDGNGMPITVAAPNADAITVSDQISATRGYPGFTDSTPNYGLGFNNVVVPAGGTYNISLTFSGSGSCFCVWFGTTANHAEYVTLNESPASVTATWNAWPGETKWAATDAWQQSVTSTINIGATPVGPFFAQLTGSHTTGGWLDSSDNPPSPIYADTSYHLKWIKNKSTLYINLNGGTSTVWGSHTQEYNTTLDVPDPTGPLITATFNGNGGQSSTPYSQINRPFREWTFSDNFHGQFANKVYTYGPEDGVTDTITANYNKATFTFPSASRDQYLFAGWATTPGGNPLYQPESTIDLEADAIFYAVWVTSPIWERKNGQWVRHLPSSATPANVNLIYKRQGGSWSKSAKIYIRQNGQWIQLKGDTTQR